MNPIRILKQYLKNRKYNKNEGYSWKAGPNYNCDFEMDRNSVVNIGENVSFRAGCAIRVRGESTLFIGNMVSFNNNCILTCRDSISIGSNVLFGPNVMIFDHDHDYKSDDFLYKFITNSIIIEDNTWIGANCTILKGAHIKKGAVIGANTIVKGIVEENCVYYNKTNNVMKHY